jgi:DnaJ-class molecular chaperone
MTKDYYVILGIGDDATLDEIKSAYRREAKKCHPDHSGEGSEPFLDLREAYEVLCDPHRRGAYDDRRAREEQGAQGVTRSARPEPIRARRPAAEPLVPTQRSSPAWDPFFDAPLSSLMSELLGHSRSQAGLRAATPGVERVQLDVLVSRKEAREGGRLRVGIPVRVLCPACRGQGGTYFFACQHCQGQGYAVDEHPVELVFPGGLAEGDQGQVLLRRSGMPDLVLVLRFLVEPH